jgi:hypothetical protein
LHLNLHLNLSLCCLFLFVLLWCCFVPLFISLNLM